ncbi:DUF397 domain-containing protein [Streptomyces smyrnaeus]|uniref:DUF397 domain-containing protein n=1 Tax=Streptomyces TaxID=1883 RepID=UPI000C1A7730|nr:MULTISPECIES: DUF397 domain-containing protein [unclassified Streptomyces]MBQ0866557.1 DUF397 domain-containing protein [Streptomyces sp. RK75]MBQ1118976.1 DUF397 domain-containing protein [Streptomyces sp. B15]MBQ1157795.1 DUF397 domain-containing protein [Streptomyces sp. A73]
MSAAIDLSSAVWRKSSYTNGEGGNCVEIAEGFPGVMPVRDSKRPDGPAVVFPIGGWAAFVAAVKAGALHNP